MKEDERRRFCRWSMIAACHIWFCFNAQVKIDTFSGHSPDTSDVLSISMMRGWVADHQLHKIFLCQEVSAQTQLGKFNTLFLGLIFTHKNKNNKFHALHRIVLIYRNIPLHTQVLCAMWIWLIQHYLQQGVKERARVPQLVMLCCRWAHLQCFAWSTGRTHGTTAGKRTKYHNIRPFKKI